MPPTSKNTSSTHDNAVFLDEEVEPQVLSMIQNATKHVTFVTPYLSLWGHLVTAIDKAISRGVGISFIIRPGEKQSTEDQGCLFATIAINYGQSTATRTMLNVIAIPAESLHWSPTPSPSVELATKKKGEHSGCFARWGPCP